jgi:hypothetical protein
VGRAAVSPTGNVSSLTFGRQIARGFGLRVDRLTIIMVKAALVWLVIGVVVGGLMPVDCGIPDNWRQ